MTTCLVCGASGAVGRFLLPRLLDDDGVLRPPLPTLTVENRADWPIGAQAASGPASRGAAPG